MRRSVLALAGLLASLGAVAAPPSTTQREVAGLVAALGQSGCRFNRNGTWYDAPAAREHLQRKYDYLERRGAATSAERFIELAGSKSSMTGRAYLVQCPGVPAVDSATWLRGALRRLRTGG
ncbi:YfeK family protein [Lysobacter xanthus]